nr:hypothetical protein [Pseudomonas aeruginosa]
MRRSAAKSSLSTKPWPTHTPEDVNNDPYASWFFKLKPSNPAELDKLLDAAGYQAAVDAEG